MFLTSKKGEAVAEGSIPSTTVHFAAVTDTAILRIDRLALDFSITFDTTQLTSNFLQLVYIRSQIVFCYLSVEQQQQQNNCVPRCHVWPAKQGGGAIVAVTYNCDLKPHNPALLDQMTFHIGIREEVTCFRLQEKRKVNKETSAINAWV